MAQTGSGGLRGFDKVLIGCGLGCAAILLGAVLAITFGTMWVFTPGRQSATEVIAGEDSLGVVRLHELADDPGTQDLFTRVLERIDEANRRQQREQLPEAWRWVSDLQGRRTDPSGLNMMIPREMTIAFEKSAGGEGVDFVVAFNPRTMVRMFKAILGLVGRAEEQELRSDHAGHPVYRFDDSSHLAFVDSTVLFSDSAAALERAIDRLEGAKAAGGAVRRTAGQGAEVPEGDWDVEGVVGNEAGLVDAFLAAARAETLKEGNAGDGETFESLAGEDVRMGFGFDVVSADVISGRALLECRDRQTAERLAAALEKGRGRQVERPPRAGSSSSSSRGSRARGWSSVRGSPASRRRSPRR